MAGRPATGCLVVSLTRTAIPIVRSGNGCRVGLKAIVWWFPDSVPRKNHIGGDAEMSLCDDPNSHVSE